MPTTSTTQRQEAPSSAPAPDADGPADTGPPDDQEGADRDGADQDRTDELLADLEGQLAVGDGPLVAVVRPDGQRYVEIDGGRTNLTSQPTWSTDGLALIWSSVSALGHEARVQRFDQDGVADGEPEISDVPGPPIFYFQWSNDGQTVLYLRNSTRLRGVEAGVLSPGGPARWMADGEPFFVAWAPDDADIAAHVGDERLALFDPAGAAPLAGGDAEDGNGNGTGQPPENPVPGQDLVGGGGFSSPAWLDDSTVLAVVSDNLAAIDVDNGRAEPLIALDGPIRFVVSPDRTKVAFQLASDLADDSVLEVSTSRSIQSQGRSLIVFDVATRGVEIVTERAAVAWEWSPDSSKLAWLELEGPISRQAGRWRFWSNSGPVPGDIGSPMLRLSRKELVNYLPFFAQYTHSIRRWSPDSSAFAMVGGFQDRFGVWIQPVDVAAEPVWVAPGDFVTWGYGPTPDPAAGRSPA